MLAPMILNFLSNPISRPSALALAISSYALSLAVLARPIVTPLGLLSYGRVWQNHVSYLDIGFARRSLWGTFLNLTGLNSLPANEYINAFFIHGLFLLALVFLAAKYLLRNKQNLTILHGFILLFSPAFVLHLAYSTGTVDYVLSCMLFASCLYVRSFFVLGLIASAGVLTHEAYFFFVPFIAVNNLCVTNSFDSSGTIRCMAKCLPLLLMPAITALSMQLFGAQAPNQASYELLMSSRLPLASGQHGFWSGYFEIFSTVSDNQQTLVKVLVDFSSNFIYAIIPLSYLLVLALIIAFSKSTMRSRFIPFYILTLFLPLGISLVATDYLRWICMSGQLCLIALITLQAEGLLQTSSASLFWAMPFSLFAPFGGAVLNYPFPIHQFLLKKLLGRFS